MANDRARVFARGFGVRFALGGGSNVGSLIESILARLGGRGSGVEASIGGGRRRESGRLAAMALGRAFAFGRGAGLGVRSLRFLTGGAGG